MAILDKVVSREKDKEDRTFVSVAMNVEQLQKLKTLSKAKGFRSPSQMLAELVRVILREEA